MFSWI